MSLSNAHSGASISWTEAPLPDEDLSILLILLFSRTADTEQVAA